jgi:DNA-binding GntR family transcriptional regulator
MPARVQPAQGAASQADQAYHLLFEAVIRCELAPDAWVTAAHCAELFGAGRTPTIQALSRLETSGFARPVKRKGWQITPLTMQGTTDILEAFSWTAPALAILAARNASDEQLQTLQALAATWPVSGAGVAPADSTPIRYLARICGNPIRAEMSHGLTAHVERLFCFATMQDAHVDESFTTARDVALSAITARDERVIPEAMREFVAAGESEVMRILQSTGSLRSVSLNINRAS